MFKIGDYVGYTRAPGPYYSGPIIAMDESTVTIAVDHDEAWQRTYNKADVKVLPPNFPCGYTGDFSNNDR